LTPRVKGEADWNCKKKHEREAGAGANLGRGLQEIGERPDLTRARPGENGCGGEKDEPTGGIDPPFPNRCMEKLVVNRERIIQGNRKTTRFQRDRGSIAKRECLKKGVAK